MAACVPIPSLPIPAIPAPFTLKFPIPQPPPVSIKFCCIQSQIDWPPIPDPLGALVVGTAEAAAMQAAIDVVIAYYRSLQPRCPRQ